MRLHYGRLLQSTAWLALLALVLLPLGGCGGDPAGKIFRYDVDGVITNLDPQFSTETGARIALDNLFEGLVTQSPEGDIRQGVARAWDISDDGLTYTFDLRRDAQWANGDAVTAADFVFTFQRLFRDGSPHAGKYTAIQNADAVRGGQMSATSLGVRAQGPHRLTITLEYPDPQLLAQLADPAAAPCNETAFETSRGRYGLEKDFVCSNGPFTLTSWTDAILQLRQNEHYQSEKPVVAGGVNLYIGREQAAQFLDGKTDIALLDRSQRDELSDDAHTSPIEKTVWCIVFNQDYLVRGYPLWGNALLRQGMALAIDRELMATEVPASFEPTQLLVPAAMRVMGKPYRSLVQLAPTMEYDTMRANRLFSLGLDARPDHALPDNATVLVPEEADEHLNIGQLQQGWQKDLSAYLKFETVTPSQIESRLASGDFQMMVMPFHPGTPDVQTLLGAFRSDSAQNYFGYRSAIYDSLLESAASQSTAQAAAEKYAQAEQQLLVDAVVVPLFFETSYLATAKGVSGIEVSPFGDHVYFKYALKE